MKIYDISQEVFGCKVFPGDPAPEKEVLSSMNKGEVCNLTAFSMCAHNGTHIDAPFHFLKDGKTIEEIPLNKMTGFCFVAEHNGDVTEKVAKYIMEKAVKQEADAYKKILIKGDAVVLAEAAKVFNEYEIDLIGNESQSVGPVDAPMEVHLEFLKKDVVLLEGIRLMDVEEGVYFLNTAPLKLKGSDGAPCRAILIDFDE